ncbi:MAG: sigma-70 family RNA polymerase sigma factor [Actinobacteria bacterium]|nr:sigma-70 family RNA polymerase sigma factor [Actinomycetota bacterium]
MSKTAAPPALGSDGANPHISTSELNEVATELVLTHGAMILRDALKYSATADDADDAYQRALEILLTKAPSADPAELIPWLRTVVRNEALDIARSRKRTASDPIESLEDEVESDSATPDELLVRGERTSTGAEALEHLTHDQVHCLLAYAQGHSYGEISELTGFTARKVTRCVTDGRRAFTSHFSAIESGSECERLEPVLQRMADGDSYAHMEARAHLRNCAGCRATLRAYREAPTRIAVLFPLPLVASAASPVGESLPNVFDQFGAVWTSANDRVGAQVAAIQHWIEVGTAKKLGAIAATAAVLTAGGVAAEHSGVLERTPEKSAVESASAPVSPTPPSLFDRIDSRPTATDRAARKQEHRRATTTPAASAPSSPPSNTQPATSSPKHVDNGSSEFLPEGR